MQKQIVTIFYKYTPIEDPEKLTNEQQELCSSLNLTGRMIIATEGINATLEGAEKDIKRYVSEMKKDPRFKDIFFKFNPGTGQTFPKLSIKVRPEIVAARLGEKDINPWNVTGKYLIADELHQWFETGKRFYIVDMRNDFEQAVGHFKGSILPGMSTFADLPKTVEILKKLEPGVPIITVCTYGVRCEKASGFLIDNGFNDVYQLYGGIGTYMEKYPDGYFKGSLYTFDQRIIIAFNMDDPNREVVGRCAKCDKPSENYINCKDPFCNRHFIACEDCLNGEDLPAGRQGKILCPMGCRDYSKEHPEAFN